MSRFVKILLVVLLVFAIVVGSLAYILLVLHNEANRSVPSPFVTPEPTASPSPFASPSPVATPEPTITPTPSPISTPVPTSAPTPTPSPSPSPTPLPSPTPSPTPSPAPALVVVNSTNWAGYSEASSLQNPQAIVTNVSASWIVPAVSPSSVDTFSAVWIGIGGMFPNDTTLIQCGTEQDSVAGLPTYYAWVELLPRSSIPIATVAVSPGDQILASIQLVNASFDLWQISVVDLTSGTSYQNVFGYASSQLSAEWIVERPQVGRTLGTLSDFGNVTFANCSATVGQTIVGVDALPANQLVMYSSPMTSASLQIADVSDPSSDGSQFTVTYVAGS